MNCIGIVKGNWWGLQEYQFSDQFFPVLSYYMFHVTCFYPSALSCFLRSQSGFGKIICVMKDTSAFKASHIIELNSLVTVDAIVLFIWNHDISEM